MTDRVDGQRRLTEEMRSLQGWHLRLSHTDSASDPTAVNALPADSEHDGVFCFAKDCKTNQRRGHFDKLWKHVFISWYVGWLWSAVGEVCSLRVQFAEITHAAMFAANIPKVFNVNLTSSLPTSLRMRSTSRKYTHGFHANGRRDPHCRWGISWMCQFFPWS